ncbi:protein sisterless A [Episyrphus balteatus]|uniref:protein sisterless A n=1 Tax=Episyrphus balteatus TaxID=286459 RepID=UPI00248617F2|nr:protein sisterless A [Episyrphus balteatus]
MQTEMQIQATNYLSGIFLQKFNPTTSEKAVLKPLACHHDLTPASVDTIIDFEMKKVMAKYTAEEASFVDQKLIENPVIVERRPSNRSGSESSSSVRDPLQQQRAESCRKSRINNKIKKAKSKFRHKFITMKLAQNAAALECIRDVIAHAEAKLKSTGCSEATLRKLRSAMGVDRMEIDNLTEITRQLGNVTDK